MHHITHHLAHRQLLTASNPSRLLPFPNQMIPLFWPNAFIPSPQRPPVSNWQNVLYLNAIVHLRILVKTCFDLPSICQHIHFGRRHPIPPPVHPMCMSRSLLTNNYWVAFNFVSCSRLLHKLKAFDHPSSFWAWLFDYFTNGMHDTWLDEKTSILWFNNSGVIWGAVHFPYAFLIEDVFSPT